MTSATARDGGGTTEPADRVSAAFAAMPRNGFLARRERRRASLDRPLPIGHGQTNSQPTTVRNMLRLIDVQPGDRVLDVGSGSGWTTALLAQLTGPTGRVYGVELVPELVTFGRTNLATRSTPWASIDQAEPGTLGLPAAAPFDRILVSAEAHSLPTVLVAQLAAPGRMVAPVAGRLSVVDRHPAGSLSERRVGHYSFVPLR